MGRERFRQEKRMKRQHIAFDGSENYFAENEIENYSGGNRIFNFQKIVISKTNSHFVSTNAVSV